MQKHGGLLGGSLLVAGTTIGGGMLALPVLTSPAGFLPSIVVYILCWLFMTCTGLLFLELALALKDEANIVTMAENTLGKSGKIFAWAVYLFLFYCLTLAYIVGCGNLLTEFSNGKISSTLGPVFFVLIFAPFVFAGAKVVGRLNIFLMFGLAFFYFCFVFIGTPWVKLELLQQRNWPKALLAFPIAFTAFAYQGTVPTLVSYLDRNAKTIRLSIILGSFLPLITYIIWQGLILGIVPYSGDFGLAEALREGQNAVYPLKYFIGNPLIYSIGQYFAFFALITSFFGVTLGLLDFLADGLKVKKTPKGKLLLCLLIFVPPLIIASYRPDIFLIALDYAGGFGCALLLGLLPILMAWSLRYRLKLSKEPQLPGGKPLLVLLTIFVLFEIAIASLL